MVWMWKPSSVEEAVENARYTEEHMKLTGDTRPTFPHRPGFVGKAPRTIPRGGGSRPPPYGNMDVPRTVAAGISIAASTTSRPSPMVEIGPRPSQGTTSRGRGSRGRNSFQNESHNSASDQSHITCWRCEGTHYQRDCRELQSGFVHREDKAPVGSM
jgi:hypothetical protein